MQALHLLYEFAIWWPWFNSWVRKIHWRRNRLPTTVFLGFSCASASKEYTCNAGDLGSIPGSGRYPKEGNDYPLLYSGLENSTDCIIHRVTKSWTQFFSGSSDGKVSACNAEDLGSIPGLGRSPGEGSDNPLQYSCLENSMDGGAW